MTSATRILITREENEDGPLGALLRSRGFATTTIPTIAHELLSRSDALRNAARRTADYDWLLFTSARGVEAFAGARDGGLSSPGAAIGCIGRATADAVARFGGEPTLVARNAGSEGLVRELAARDAIRGRRFLYPTSDAARPTLADGIRHHGGHIDEIAAYRTVPTNAGGEVAEALRGGDIGAVVFCSPSAIEALRDSALALAALREYDGRIVAMGPTTRSAIEAVLGGADVVEPAERTFEGIADAIEAMR